MQIVNTVFHTFSCDRQEKNTVTGISVVTVKNGKTE